VKDRVGDPQIPPHGGHQHRLDPLAYRLLAGRKMDIRKPTVLTRRPIAMASVRTPEAGPAVAQEPYVPRLTADELAQRSKALVELLDSWESEGDEQEQRETLNVLREALGERRVASSRALFP
jgi:hypothetical protein